MILLAAVSVLSCIGLFVALYVAHRKDEGAFRAYRERPSRPSTIAYGVDRPRTRDTYVYADTFDSPSVHSDAGDSGGDCGSADSGSCDSGGGDCGGGGCD